MIKKHETITGNSPVLIHTNETNNRIIFKIKTGYKLELLSKETMRLLGSQTNNIDKDKDGELVPKLESANLVLMLCKVLFTFVPDKTYGQLITVSPHA